MLERRQLKERYKLEHKSSKTTKSVKLKIISWEVENKEDNDQTHFSIQLVINTSLEVLDGFALSKDWKQ